MTQPSHRTVRTGPYTAPVSSNLSASGGQDSRLYGGQVEESEAAQPGVGHGVAGQGAFRIVPASHPDVSELTLVPELP